MQNKHLKNIRRLFIEPSFVLQDRIEISGENYHHAIHVLRLKQGDRVDILSGQMNLYACELIFVDKKKAVARIQKTVRLPDLPNPKIILALCLPRLSTLEAVVEKSVELGVSQIQPLFSEHSFYKSPKEYPAEKNERLMKIIRSATEQTQRGDLMKLEKPLHLADWAQSLVNSTKGLADKVCSIFAFESYKDLAKGSQAIESSMSLKNQLQINRAQHSHTITALCGSEGGLSLKEAELLQSLNQKPVGLGHNILRVETACLALISAIKYEFGQF